MIASTHRRLLLLLLRGRRGDAVTTSHYHSRNTIAAAIFTFRSPTPTTKSHPPYSSSATSIETTAAYLVASCGLCPSAALSAASKTRLKSAANADAVLALLKRHSLSDAQIAKIFTRFPKLLNYDPEKTLKPKIDFFLGLGFSRPALGKLFALDALLLGRSLKHHLIPCADFLRGILCTEERIVAAFARFPRALQHHPDRTMRPALQALRDHGVPDDKIAWIVVTKPSVLALSPDRVGEIVELVKATGLNVTGSQFSCAVCTLCSLKRSTWERKIALFVSFGLSESEILAAFRIMPTIFGFSEEKIQKALRFFLDKLQFSLADIMRRPVLLGISLEKTILPRCTVLSVLIREGKIGEDVNLLRAIRMDAKWFLETYVTKYQDGVPDVLKAFQGEIEFEGFGDRLVGSPLTSRRRSSRAKV